MKLKCLTNKLYYLTIGSGIASIGYFVHSFISKNYIKSESTVTEENTDKNYIYLSNDYISADVSDEGIIDNNEQLSSHVHYQLLRLAQVNRDPTIRHFAIETIAKSQFEDYQYKEIAQSCDFETSLTLARIPNVNQKLFLQPIKTESVDLTTAEKPLRFDFDDLLLHMLKESNSSVNQCSECTQYFTQIAIRILEIKRSSGGIRDNIDYNEIHDHKRSKFPAIDWICLQAIMENILCGENQCLKLVNNGLFLILHHLREKFTDMKVQTWVAQTLANLSIYSEIHYHFFRTGFIGILSQWLQSNQLELSLSAAKVLHNLNSKTEGLLSESLFLFHPIFYESNNKDFDVIFIHGLRGGVFRTWRQNDSEKSSKTYTRCWPQSWLANDFNNIRILGVNYQTFLSNWNIECQDNKWDLKDRSSQLISDLKSCKVGDKPIIWVTHSMGGLLVKQILVDIDQCVDDNHNLKNILLNTKGIVFYSVPHKGSDIAVWPQGLQRIISPSSEVLTLRKDSSILHQLNDSFLKIINNKQIKCLSFGETLKSTIVSKPIKWSYLLVPESSSNPGVGLYHTLPVDHHNTCKPIDKSSEAYYIVNKFIKDIIESEIDKYGDRYDRISLLLSSVFS